MVKATFSPDRYLTRLVSKTYEKQYVLSHWLYHLILFQITEIKLHKKGKPKRRKNGLLKSSLPRNKAMVFDLDHWKCMVPTDSVPTTYLEEHALLATASVVSHTARRKEKHGRRKGLKVPQRKEM